MAYISPALRYQVLRRDGHKCRYCGISAEETKLVVDHVYPEALGGETKPENLASACVPCNGGKSATPPDAAFVAQVEKDTEAWAIAIREAGARDDAERDQQRQHHELFYKSWSSYADGRGSIYELPTWWRNPINSYISGGLTDADLADLVESVMARPHVVDRFRYFCGAARSRVGTRQDEVVDNLVRLTPPAVTAAERQSSPGGMPIYAEDDEEVDWYEYEQECGEQEQAMHPTARMRWTRPATSETHRQYGVHMSALFDEWTTYWAEAAFGTLRIHRKAYHLPACVPTQLLGFDAWRSDLTPYPIRPQDEELEGVLRAKTYCPRCCLPERAAQWPQDHDQQRYSDFLRECGEHGLEGRSRDEAVAEAERHERGRS